MWCRSPVRSPFGSRRCKQCPECAEHYRYEWFVRLLSAHKSHLRTHFVTLTFNPLMRAKYSHVQKWVKRCRKAKMKFLYFCVAEPHARPDDTGAKRWHYHLLIFTDEQFASRRLREHWKGGISHAKLTRLDHIEYCCKYITKGIERPRASNGLAGKLWREADTHVLVQAAIYWFPGSSVQSIRLFADGWDGNGEYYHRDIVARRPKRLGETQREDHTYSEEYRRERGYSGETSPAIIEPIMDICGYPIPRPKAALKKG